MLALSALLVLAPQALSFERFVSPHEGLNQITDIRSIPGGEIVYVAERAGRIRLVRDGLVDAQPFVDVGDLLETTGNVGLRCFAFHPDYAFNGYVYLWFDAPNGTVGVDGVLIRITRDAANPDRLDRTTEVELLRVPQDGRTHGGGAIQFDDQGMLLLGIGDGSEGGDQFCRAQDRSNLLGSIIRLDVDGGVPYAIPSDNPFRQMPGVRSEIYHYGFRHPWKWVIDPVDGSMWIADVGHFQREEIDYAPPGAAGLNFGWSVREGTQCFTNIPCNASLPPCGSSIYTAPVHEFDHNGNCSVTGGDVYRGGDIPWLDGRYVYSDFCSNRVWSIAIDPVTGASDVIEHSMSIFPMEGVFTLTSAIGVDPNGELLFADYADGEIYRLAPQESVVATCPGEPNGTGVGATLTAAGTTSLSNNDLVFHVEDAPPFSLGVLFYGPEPTIFPWANGVRCVDGGNGTLLRVKFDVSSAAGDMLYPVDLQDEPFSLQAGRVQIGTTMYFQAWYRDISGPLGLGTNFSSALSVRFRP